MSSQNKTSFVITNFPSSKRLKLSSDNNKTTDNNYQKFLSCPVCHRTGFKTAIATRDHVISNHPEKIPPQYQKNNVNDTSSTVIENKNNNNQNDDASFLAHSHHHHHQEQDHDYSFSTNNNNNSSWIKCEISDCHNHGQYFPKTPAKSTIRKLIISVNSHHHYYHICNECILKKFKVAYSTASLFPLEIPVENIIQPGQSFTSSVIIRESTTIGIIPSSAWEKLHHKIMKQFLQQQVEGGKYIKCPKCSFVVEKINLPNDDENNNNNNNNNNDKKQHSMATIEGTVCTAETAKHFHDNRLRCAACSASFCTSCFTSPYHVGYTCEQFEERGKNVCCRFCSEVIISVSNPIINSCADATGKANKNLNPIPMDVCKNNPECVEKAKSCCPIKLPCGHPCYFASPFHDDGDDDDTNNNHATSNIFQEYHDKNFHYCLHQECSEFRKIYQSSSSTTATETETEMDPNSFVLASSESNHEDWCSICYCDTLAGGSPVIRLSNSCGHVFHLDCVKRKLASKWTGASISFNFLTCANCNKIMDAPELRNMKNGNHNINDDDNEDEEKNNNNNNNNNGKRKFTLLENILQFRSKVHKLMLQRLKFEGLENHPEITENKGGKFFQQPELYAEHTFAFYPCFKCGDPFYGGHNRCEAIMMNENDDDDGDNNENNENNNKKFNPENLLCVKCTPDGEKRTCKIHGSAFILFKCKFCCNVASFFCWGNTHFCANCHHVQEGGRYLNKLPIEELPVCPGVGGGCPLGMSHPVNGTAEFAVGCALCKQ